MSPCGTDTPVFARRPVRSNDLALNQGPPGHWAQGGWRMQHWAQGGWRIKQPVGHRGARRSPSATVRRQSLSLRGCRQAARQSQTARAPQPEFGCRTRPPVIMLPPVRPPARAARPAHMAAKAKRPWGSWVGEGLLAVAMRWVLAWRERRRTCWNMHVGTYVPRACCFVVRHLQPLHMPAAIRSPCMPRTNAL